MSDANPANPSLIVTLARAIEGVNANGSAWLMNQLRGSSANAIASSFSWVGRKVGETRLDITVGELPTPEPGWDTAVCARLALLLHFAQSHAVDAQHRLLSDLYYRGDTAEKCAVLRCLPLLAEPSQYLLIATDSVRSHVQPVVEAVTCENPFPARHFEDAAFNQLVMKAYFTGVPVRRIFGLRERRNADLSRMAQDFAAERTAAGRPVPTDLTLVIATS